MNISDRLVQCFNGIDSERKIVFWYDANPERELGEIIEAIKPLSAELWELTEDNQFTTKYQLEVAAPGQSYLVYARFPEPPKEKNWLLDILLYAKKFEADDIAMLMHRFGVEQQEMRDFFQQHRKFFNNADRIKRLGALLPPGPDQEQLALGMLAVLAGAGAPQPGDIVRHVLLKGLDEDGNKAFKDIKSFFGREKFWELAGKYFGYKAGQPELKELLKTLVYSHFALQVDFQLPQTLACYHSRMANSCRIFIDDWLSGVDQEVAALKDYLAGIELQWDIAGLLSGESVENYRCYDTFMAVEERLVRRLAEELENETADQEQWQSILNERRPKHWHKQYAGLYRPLEAGLLLYGQKLLFESLVPPDNGKDWVDTYCERLNLIDRYVRQFFYRYQSAQAPEILQKLAGNIDYWYNHVFLSRVAGWTTRLLDDGLLRYWTVGAVLQQRFFYRERVEPLLKGNGKAIVVISDALRYEAGSELAGRLAESMVNMEIALEPMQASLPGYTALGMASLLPGKELLFVENGEVLRDGQTTAGLSVREAVLKKYLPASRAMRLTDFLALPTKEAAAWFTGQRVIYFYHDVIDATGDSQKSETYTFRAVEEAIKELEGGVARLVRTYGATRILITADHGFLYQMSPSQSPEKVEAITGNIYSGNHRFALGRNLSSPAGTRKLSLAYLGVEEEAVIAIGLNRFSTRGGGTRFVHGGAMPQEVIVPVITCRQVRDKERTCVDIRLANRERMITDHRFKIIFFQEQRVDEQFGPRHLRVALYQGEERISNEISLVFDSVEEVGQRQKEIIFSLREKQYLPGERCILRLDDVTKAKTVIYREEELELRLYNSLL